MTGRTRLLRLSSLVAIAALLSAVAGVESPWLRTAVGFPLVTLLPGYAVVCTLLPDGLDRLERFALSLGVSLIVVIFLGFAGAALPAGLRGTTWVWLLGGVTLVANGLAFVRSRDVQEPERRRLPTGAIAVAVLAGCFAILLVAFSPRAELPPSSGEVVQLWALPERAAGGAALRVGVGNLVCSTTLFHVRVVQGDTTLLDKTTNVPLGKSASFRVWPSPQGDSVTVVLTSVGSSEIRRMVTVSPGTLPVTRSALR